MAEALCDTVLGEGNYTILDRYVGTDLEHREYEPLYHFVSPKEKCWYITCDTYVTLTDGTGIVHIAPAFGEDDANVGRKYGLPPVSYTHLIQRWLSFSRPFDESVCLSLDCSVDRF